MCFLTWHCSIYFISFCVNSILKCWLQLAPPAYEDVERAINQNPSATECGTVELNVENRESGLATCSAQPSTSWKYFLFISIFYCDCFVYSKVRPVCMLPNLRTSFAPESTSVLSLWKLTGKKLTFYALLNFFFMLMCGFGVVIATLYGLTLYIRIQLDMTLY